MEFERPIAELEEKLAHLKKLDLGEQPELVVEIEQLEAEIDELRIALYSNLAPWDRVQISRHPERPKTDDYLETLFADVVEVHGDRLGGDDGAMFAGLATLAGRRLAVLGHRKGKNTNENIARNFGSPHPAGFRKAERVMRLADRFGLPIVTFLDTAGAYPGLDDEAHGQAWAIASCLATLSRVGVPVVVVGHRRGRQRRCARHRVRRPAHHARERLLLGHQPRDVRDHPAQGRAARVGRGRLPAAHR